MQRAASLGHIVDVGRSADDGVHQARLCIRTNVRLHTEVPLIGLLDPVHLRVTFAGLALGRTGCRNQRGVHHRAGLEQQALIRDNKTFRPIGLQPPMIQHQNHQRTHTSGENWLRHTTHTFSIAKHVLRPGGVLVMASAAARVLRCGRLTKTPEVRTP